jgi:hypothetical protein
VPVNANEMYCDLCLQKGHTCRGHDLVDGKVLCVWCLDGVTCPNSKKGTGAVRPAPASIAKGDEQTMPTVTQQKCKAPGCNRSPRQDNGSGYCGNHHHLSKRKISPAMMQSRQNGRREPGRLRKVVPNGSDNFVTLECTVEALDRFLVGLPVPDKQLLANAWLTGRI